MTTKVPEYGPDKPDPFGIPIYGSAEAYHEADREANRGFRIARTFAVILAVVSTLIVVVSFEFRENHRGTWTAINGFDGAIGIVSEPGGNYFRAFRGIAAYPTVVDLEERRAIVTLRDGRKLEIAYAFRVSLPTNPKQLMRIHLDFNGHVQALESWVNEFVVNGLKLAATDIVDPGAWIASVGVGIEPDMIASVTGTCDEFVCKHSNKVYDPATDSGMDDHRFAHFAIYRIDEQFREIRKPGFRLLRLVVHASIPEQAVRDSDDRPKLIGRRAEHMIEAEEK